MRVKERPDGSVVLEFASDEERDTHVARLKRMAAAASEGRALDRALANSDLGSATKRAMVHRDQRLRELDLYHGLLTSREVAAQRGSTSKNSAQVVQDLRTNYRVPTVQRGRRRLVPAFVFTNRGQVQPWVQPVCEALAAIGFDEESQVFWLTAPNAYLDGATPLQALGHPTDNLLDRVLYAARQRAHV